MRWTTALGSLVVCFASSGSAWADAVPPPPDNCPPGKVPVTDHRGPRCERKAPTNCPSGWRGVVGGTCALHQCTEDAHCGDDKVCREVSLCYKQETRYYTYGQNDYAPVRGPELGMGPPMQLDPPVTEWVAFNVCDTGSACPAPAECRPGKLCVAMESESSSGSAAVPARSMPTKADGTVDTRPSGCGSGCAGAPAGSLPGAALAAFVALAFGLRRWLAAAEP